MSEIPIFTRDISFPQKEIEDEFPRLPVVPRTEYYGRVPFDQAFDVPQILQLAAQRRDLPYGATMYVVDFASKAKAAADHLELIKLDNAAHREAAESDGFLIYFRGDKDPGGYTRSFCVWESLPHAKLASRKPAHSEAALAADTMYDFYQVTMREARLVPTVMGYEFGPEAIHAVGEDDKYLSIAASGLYGASLGRASDPQLPLSA